jgi:hypothetical protein
MLKLVKDGKIPHEVELEKHPEKSLEGRMWLMGKVAGAINVNYLLFLSYGQALWLTCASQEIKPAKAM